MKYSIQPIDNFNIEFWIYHTIGTQNKILVQKGKSDIQKVSCQKECMRNWISMKKGIPTETF